MRNRRYKLSRPSPTGPQDSAKGRKAVWFWLVADCVPDHTSLTLPSPHGEGFCSLARCPDWESEILRESP